MTLSYAPRSVTRSASARFSPSWSTTTGGCEGILHQASISRKPSSQSPCVLAARRSSSTTSHHSRNSFRLLNSNSLETLYSNALPSARAIAPVSPASWLTKHTCTVSSVNVRALRCRFARHRSAVPTPAPLRRRPGIAVRDSVRWAARSLSPPTASREQFCKGFTDRKRCANGAIIGRKSIHPAKLIAVNQMRKVQSRARARRTCGTAVQVRIICILLLCYFPIARYKYGCNRTLTALCVT